jgi:hypothetical protein
MPLENSTNIADLDQSWPLGGDPTNKGDDHLRLIKAVLKTQFPGTGGNGFSTPILATEAELNFVQGASSNIQDQLDTLSNTTDNLEANLSAPAGTTMVFYQAAAPTGWTQNASLNDFMLRIINTAGGTSGGTNSPILTDFTHNHSTAAHTLTIAEMPNHSHTYETYVGFRGASSGSSQDGAKAGNTSAVGGGAAHSHGNTGTATIQFRPKYLNTILAVKDA